MKIYRHSKVWILLFTIVALCVYLRPHQALALTLTPARFEVSGNPGDVLEEEILLINEGNNTEVFYSSFSNFEAQGDSGTPAFVEPKDDLGTWMNTPASVSLLPGEQKIVPFKISIPKSAEPGGHFAVVFWGNTPPGGGKSGVSVGAKTGVLVLLSVAGDVAEAGGLLDFGTKGQKFFYKTLPISFEYRFKNDGGDRIKPEGQIVIHDTIYLPADRLNGNPVEGNILPGSTRKFNVDWVRYERPFDYVPPANFFKKFFSEALYEWKNFAVGFYFANLNLTYGTHGQHAEKTKIFFVFPWELLVVLLCLFFLVFFGGKRLIRRYNRWIIAKARASNA
jgi:hypothetical protein